MFLGAEDLTFLAMQGILTFVLATPISGPALICTPQSVSRDMELPTVFVIPTVRAPLSLQYRRAIKVSAVSPTGTDESCLVMVLKILYFNSHALAGSSIARTLFLLSSMNKMFPEYCNRAGEISVTAALQTRCTCWVGDGDWRCYLLNIQYHSRTIWLEYCKVFI